MKSAHLVLDYSIKPLTPNKSTGEVLFLLIDKGRATCVKGDVDVDGLTDVCFRLGVDLTISKLNSVKFAADLLLYNVKDYSTLTGIDSTWGLFIDAIQETKAPVLHDLAEVIIVDESVDYIPVNGISFFIGDKRTKLYDSCDKSYVSEVGKGGKYVILDKLIAGDFVKEIAVVYSRDLQFLSYCNAKGLYCAIPF